MIKERYSEIVARYAPTQTHKVTVKTFSEALNAITDLLAERNELIAILQATVLIADKALAEAHRLFGQPEGSE